MVSAFFMSSWVTCVIAYGLVEFSHTVKGGRRVHFQHDGRYGINNPLRPTCPGYGGPSARGNAVRNRKGLDLCHPEVCYFGEAAAKWVVQGKQKSMYVERKRGNRRRHFTVQLARL